MVDYEWTCLSCGHANQPAAQTCAACACPASATVKQIAEFRDKYASQGGTVLAAAASMDDPDGKAALSLVGKIFLTGFAWLTGAKF